MFRTTFYFLYILCVNILNAQENLIVNGSFEEYTSCPTGNDLGNGQFQKCVGWWYSNPSGIGTPDYFNRCNTGIVSVPNNFWGHQEPYDGDGYVGILPAEWYITEGVPFGKEIIQTRLKEPLKICGNYIFKMHINLSNLSNYNLSKIELNFSKDSLFHNSVAEIDSVYKNRLNINLLDIDTSNWLVVYKEFVAKEPYQFLSIGFFSEFNSVDTLYLFESNGFYPNAAPYFFIDNIQLHEIPSVNISGCHLQLPNTFTPNNDGANDNYDLSEYLNVFDIYILNRWGNTVFELTDFSTAWDGTSKNGQPCADGVYYYYVRNKETKENVKSGFIHLFR